MRVQRLCPETAPESAPDVRRAKAALSSGCKSRPANSLPPEATGAVVEVTKWLKPSDSVSRTGDSASVQAATQVNAVQTSKRTMCGPTWPSYRGRLVRLGDRAKTTPIRRTGVVAAACTQGKRTQHGKPHCVAGETANRTPARDRPGALG